MSRITILAIILAVGVLASAALADGFLLPLERPHHDILVPNELFTVKYHYVNVTIDNQLCTTKVDQVFHNDSAFEREGMYIFPMPEGAAITKFSMYAGEDEIIGKILDKTEARSIYESIVRQRKDPALLEYIDRNTFRASVYPIPAKGDKRIRLSYAEVIGKSGNVCRYVYPLSTERFSAKPLEDCKVTIKLKSKRSITNIYSPTHQIKVNQTSSQEATVTWQAKNSKPDTDMVLYYSVSNDDVGIDLLTHKEKGENGYFMLLASPRVDLEKAKIQPKNVVFVLDRTGSMVGEKMDQAKEALIYCINSLKSEDQFNLITFNETPILVFNKPVKASKANKKKALDAVEAIEATGGTNINEALIQAKKQYAASGSPQNYVVFLTDGLPTVGKTDVDTILKNAQTGNSKTFAFGVGYDVNTHLLDKLAQQNRGTTEYVRPKENIEVKVSAFFSKVSDPILADVTLKITGAKTLDMFPSTDIPDIFKGSQLLLFGRYEGSGQVKIELSGMSGDTKKTFTLSGEMPAKELSNEFIPQLWASRKIGYLLDEIRLHKNQELVDEVVRLSKKYGIPTEFTSFLADERKTDAAMEAEMKRVRITAGSTFSESSGNQSVASSSNSSAARKSAQMPAASATDLSVYATPDQVQGTVAANGRFGGTYQDKDDRTVIVANVQNIARRTFYQRGAFWEDGDLVPDQKLVQIKQFSDAHFKLLKAYPKLSQYSTLGNVRFVLENKQAVEVGPEGKESMTDAEIADLLKNSDGNTELSNGVRNDASTRMAGSSDHSFLKYSFFVFVALSLFAWRLKSRL